jgi:hypothetical protein
MCSDYHTSGTRQEIADQNHDHWHWSIPSYLFPLVLAQVHDPRTDTASKTQLKWTFTWRHSLRFQNKISNNFGANLVNLSMTSLTESYQGSGDDCPFITNTLSGESPTKSSLTLFLNPFPWRYRIQISHSVFFNLPMSPLSQMLPKMCQVEPVRIPYTLAAELIPANCILHIPPSFWFLNPLRIKYDGI